MNPLTPPRTLLIDGDIFIFQAASANEYNCQWSPFLWTRHARLDDAISQLDDTLNSLQSELEGTEMVVALTDAVNFRKTVMPSYKHHRVNTPKPVIYQALREYVAETRRTYQRPGLEGDDVLGILSTHPHLIKGEKIIVSVDKDMNTIPGLFVNLTEYKRAKEAEPNTFPSMFLKRVTEEAADRYHLLQTLTGDVTDGYPGCPGFGPKTAEALLDEGMVLEPKQKVISRGPRKGEQETSWEPSRPGSMWEIIVSAYASKGLSEEVALQNARVARILRGRDYDFDKKEVRLWQPAR